MYKKLSIIIPLLLGGCASYGWYNSEVTSEQALIDVSQCKIESYQLTNNEWRNDYWRDRWNHSHKYYKRYGYNLVNRQYYQNCLQAKGYRYIQIK